MASIHKDSLGRSPYWYCAYYGADGRRMQRSTRQTDRKAAREICFLWEKAGHAARRHELTAAAGRRVIAEMVAISSGEVLEFHSVEGWIRSWLASKKGSTASATFTKYAQVAGRFITFLGPRAASSLDSVSATDITRFRDRLAAEGRKAQTANLARNVLNIAFEKARRQGLIPFNPVGAVEPLRSSKGQGLAREVFSHNELSRLVAQAQGEWRGAILLGATSGLRLSDVAGLRWEAIDFEKGLLRVVTGKTGAVVVLPMHSDFASWLTSNAAGLRGIGKAFVFPGLAETATSGSHGLSRQFRTIMEKAEITEHITQKGGRQGRTRSSKSFHSLRHTFVSTLANSGVASELRQKLVGHSDSGVHKIYTHLEFQPFRDAVAGIPSILAGPA
jgi:integrase